MSFTAAGADDDDDDDMIWFSFPTADDLLALKLLVLKNSETALKITEKIVCRTAYELFCEKSRCLPVLYFKTPRRPTCYFQ